MRAREAAVRALLACEKRGAWSDAYLNGLFDRESPDRREAALAYRICAGVLQNREACDFYLRPYIKGKLQSGVRAILGSAVYQIAYMDRIPVSAAVNEAVELTKRLENPGAAGLVNAVLRRLTEGELPQLPRGDDPESLSVRFSHPQPWTEYFLKLLGPEKTKAMLTLNNQPSPISFRVNRRKASAEEAAEALKRDGLEIRAAVMDNFFLVENAGDVTSLRAFREGLVIVQDPAAALPVYAAGVKPGMRVLDCCAAPGGKSFLLAEQMENRGSILSCDLHGNKLRRIEEGAQRLGIGIIETCAADASRPLGAMLERFDLVLADVPCSGLGVIRKKPEIRYKTMEQVSPLPKTQMAILEGAASCLKSGGTLVYSTCTLLREENEGVTDAFLARHPEFQREPFRLPGPFGNVEEGQRTIWPFEYETDGFYLCRMRKKT
ncbi:MAG: 16S rRNA (cytosine(967)-C(5))-methyltransferase RsmB [Oscillospiraceae bacterium]|nr:16S rRNA (cytosine(967)-C(5))-methyltransferase RsmB [Oscillospiraceae bacterium]